MGGKDRKVVEGTWTFIPKYSHHRIFIVHKIQLFIPLFFSFFFTFFYRPLASLACSSTREKKFKACEK